MTSSANNITHLSDLHSENDNASRIAILAERAGGIAALSRLSGVADSTLRSYLLGTIPGADKAVQIANATGTTVSWIATGHKSFPVAEIKIHQLKKLSSINDHAALCRAYFQCRFELAQAGLTDGDLSGPDDESLALVIEHQGDVIAFTIYNEAEDKSFWISHSWVAPDFRKQGLHTALFNKLVQIARKSGIKKIQSCHNAKNKAAAAAFLKQGRTAELVQYTYAVGKA